MYLGELRDGCIADNCHCSVLTEQNSHFKLEISQIALKFQVKIVKFIVVNRLHIIT